MTGDRPTAIAPPTVEERPPNGPDPSGRPEPSGKPEPSDKAVRWPCSASAAWSSATVVPARTQTVISSGRYSTMPDGARTSRTSPFGAPPTSHWVPPPRTTTGSRGPISAAKASSASSSITGGAIIPTPRWASTRTTRRCLRSCGPTAAPSPGSSGSAGRTNDATAPAARGLHW